jgi:hypothetical protein
VPLGVPTAGHVAAEALRLWNHRSYDIRMQLSPITPSPLINVQESPAAEVLRFHGDDFQSLGATAVAVDAQTVSLQFDDRATRDFAVRVVRPEVRGVQLLFSAPKSLEGGGTPVGQTPEALAARLEDARLSGVAHIGVKDGSFVFDLNNVERVGSAQGPFTIGKDGTTVVVPIIERPKAAVRLPELVLETIGGLPVEFHGPTAG